MVMPAQAQAPAEKEVGSNHQFDTGARRSHKEYPYHELPYVFMQRLGAVMARGRRVHGELNWQQGMPMSDTFNHIINHLYQWSSSPDRLRRTPECQDLPGFLQDSEDGRFEDDLAAAAWGIMVLMWHEEFMPQMDDVHPLQEMRMRVAHGMDAAVSTVGRVL